MTHRLLVAVAIVVATSLAAVAPASAQELLISAAVSMKDAVTELGRTFASRRSGVTVRYNFGGSGELQKQIEAGAPVDLFVSAATRQMDALEQRGLILPSSRRVFARNVLVVIRPAGSPADLARPADLLDPRVRKVTVGNPRTVPVGQYTEESLRALGLWERLEPRLVFAENVRQALDYVARGEVDAGFVYATDVSLRRDRVREAFRPPEDTYGPVTYPVAVIKDSRHPALGQAFIDVLLGADGRAVLRRLGFLLPPPGR
jgi:molybdate transport system substrate-binding protein